MTDREYDDMMDQDKRFAEEVKKMTREEALSLLVRCGHLDQNGNFTEPYKHLETVIKKIKPS